MVAQALPRAPRGHRDPADMDGYYVLRRLGHLPGSDGDNPARGGPRRRQAEEWQPPEVPHERPAGVLLVPRRSRGALLTGGVISTAVVSWWQYIDFGLLWKRHVNDPEFEEDWGVFTVKEIFSDFWLGVARNPRCLHKWLPKTGGFDIKRFSNARAGLTIWIICNWSYMAAVYYGCTLNDGGEPVCQKTGDWSRIGPSAVFISLAHWYYIFDYNWNEPAYLTTTDLRHDLYGFMLAYGCCGFLAWYYPIAFMGHIAGQTEPLVGNNVNFGIGLTLYLIGMFLFRRTNIEKHNFRTYVAEGGDLSKYMVWGKPVDYIKTEEGSYLLCSGYWKLA